MARGRYRLDTPKGKTQFAYDTEGEEAARRVAEQNGVTKKIKRWFRIWGEKKIPVRVVPGAPDSNRVYATYDPDKELGTVVARGEEVSMVRWDWLPGAYPQAERNDSLLPFKPSTKRERVRVRVRVRKT